MPESRLASRHLSVARALSARNFPTTIRSASALRPTTIRSATDSAVAIARARPAVIVVEVTGGYTSTTRTPRSASGRRIRSQRWGLVHPAIAGLATLALADLDPLAVAHPADLGVAVDRASQRRTLDRLLNRGGPDAVLLAGRHLDGAVGHPLVLVLLNSDSIYVLLEKIARLNRYFHSHRPRLFWTWLSRTRRLEASTDTSTRIAHDVCGAATG